MQNQAALTNHKVQKSSKPKHMAINYGGRFGIELAEHPELGTQDRMPEAL
jgi:hypothetical protein